MSEAVEFGILDDLSPECIERHRVIGEANQHNEAERRREGLPKAEVIPFPATRQRRFDIAGEHLYRRGEALRAHKRQLKRLGVAQDRIDKDVSELALALGFRKYRG